MEFDIGRGEIRISGIEIEYAGLDPERPIRPLSEAAILFKSIEHRRNLVQDNLTPVSGLGDDPGHFDTPRMGTFQERSILKITHMMMGQLLPYLPDAAEGAESFLRGLQED